MGRLVSNSLVMIKNDLQVYRGWLHSVRDAYPDSRIEGGFWSEVRTDVVALSLMNDLWTS